MSSGSVDAKLLRCAIYTRKSSEEGLEQDFNSLHAQREACEAYIQSQRHEGWRLVRGDKTVGLDRYAYDDGGLSGGTTERPGLQALLRDVEDGLIDVIVVYKVDRLTRSLADFARIVDILDRREVSFVSVTQSFNTTSSMGRLTLNVLLSFAQFEREVTAERIRDKIAASKRKGMWMGGPVPLGYEAKDRMLIIVEDDAKVVRWVFETYLRTRSIVQTKVELDAAGLRTRIRKKRNGAMIGGVPFSVGALSKLLRNRVYIGKTVHKGDLYEGQHQAIIEPDLFERVQRSLAERPGGNVTRSYRRSNESADNSNKLADRTPDRLLTGKIYDGAGFLMSPTHTNKKGARYGYYQSIAIGQNRKAEAGTPHRVPAPLVERTVMEALRDHADVGPVDAHPTGHAFIPSRSDVDLLDGLLRIDVFPGAVRLTLKPRNAAWPHDHLAPSNGTITAPVVWSHSARCMIIKSGEDAREARRARKNAHNAAKSETLSFAIARAHLWYRQLRDGSVASIPVLARQEGRSVRSIRLGLSLAWLAPDIVEAALAGKLNPNISATDLARSVPSCWQEQRVLVGLREDDSAS